MKESFDDGVTDPEMSEQERDWLIWSYEHDAWWGTNNRGYTKDLESAGRYTKREAARICCSANLYGDKVNEVMVPLAKANAWQLCRF